MDYLEALRDSSHPDHREMVEWRGPSFNPERGRPVGGSIIKKGRRYETSALIEGQYEPGSRVDFGMMGGNSRKGYFAAVQAGMGGDYVPMGKIFSAVIRRTLRKRA